MIVINQRKEMNSSEHPVSLHLFVMSVCIRIHDHLYMNSYIHELLIYQDTRSCVSGQESHVTHKCVIYRNC